MGNKSSSAGVDTADVNNNASPSHMGNKSAGNDDTFFSNNEAPPVPPRSKLQPPRRPSYMSQAKAGYRELCNAIVRPPRCEYTIEHLGPSAFKFCGKMFTRTDFQLDTIRGPTLQCSHWEPVERTQDRIPVVVYMHGNSSARVEAIGILSYVLSLGISLFTFDFAGSGQSDGEFVSLGHFEKEDLNCVIQHLRATNVVSTIALWGRSMGAATALMHADRDPTIACMVLDSSFSSLVKLAEEMVEKGREQGVFAPSLLVSLAIRMIKNSVQKLAKFNIRDISPITHAPKCFIPALFIAGEDDNFIDKSHSQELYTVYAGDKNIIIVDGDHNSSRPNFMFDSVCIFLRTCLLIQDSWGVEIYEGCNLALPPWYLAGRKSTSTSTLTSTSMRVASSTSNDPVIMASLGMTSERQQAIQASLLQCFTGAEQPPKSPVRKNVADVCDAFFDFEIEDLDNDDSDAGKENAAPPLLPLPPQPPTKEEQTLATESRSKNE